jgi:hypothetical protein
LVRLTRHSKLPDLGFFESDLSTLVLAICCARDADTPTDEAVAHDAGIDLVLSPGLNPRPEVLLIAAVASQ